ncbi:penicillin-binding protein 1C [Roseiarcus fermentans]|uniref:peptidoglycan glycosyltransferase n=1 Tax=Roseiarcus fermentans TaxID=1473586 RepID=A0A366EEN1_9HYPH|nr:penicillin-binding protein 1C [Roseiarcus fermentans]
MNTAAQRRRDAIRRGLVLAIAAPLLLVLVSALAAGLAWTRYAASLPPLDLAASREGSTLVVDRDGRLLRPFTLPDGRWRLPATTHDVDPRYLAMLVAYEDGRFYDHHGVDLRALLRAAGQWLLRGHIVSGGSTLTMQVARLIEPRPERTLEAKLRQMARAQEIERAVDKAGVLDRYVTLAPFGGNLEGVRAASLAYFGKEPLKLTIAEAALLVALPQSPEARRPDRFPSAARAARDRVLDRAAARGAIGADDAVAAKREPVPETRKPFPRLAAHAAEEAVAADPRARRIRLSIDARLQAKLETLARESVARLGPKLSAAIVAIDNASGEVRARVGAADPDDASRDGAIDMSRFPRSPGSALKPFIYALAFEEGLAHPETVLFDRPARYGAYAPENFDLGYQGTVTARKALQMSLNLPAVELLADVGPATFLARLHGAGAEIALPKDTPIGLAIGLGGLGVSLTDIARLYAGFARGGEAPALIERLDGAAPVIGPRRVTDSVAAWYVADILRGTPPPANALSGRIAFKTGTSYGFRDALAVGFDKGTTIAVWVGRPDNGPTPGLIGRQAAAPILFDAFERLCRDVEVIRPPRGILIAATAADLPPPLRHLRKDAPKTMAATEVPALKIAYPPDGARIDLGILDGAAEARLALKALGGVPPFAWFVNGAPVGEAELRRNAAWKPDGAGFVRVTVVDSKGAADAVRVRLE